MMLLRNSKITAFMTLAGKTLLNKFKDFGAHVRPGEKLLHLEKCSFRAKMTAGGRVVEQLD